MTLAAGSRLGAYEILSPLGAGGMGEVWRARDTKLGREVALKVLPQSVAGDPERLARFEREAQLLASLNHPHIAAIHGVEDSTPTKALVLELVEGETLADVIARGPIPIAPALAFAGQIVEALAAAHEKGIVHRDLKPANVKLDADGQVKVLDFGLAKALDPVGAVPGSPSASPTLMHSPTLTAAGTQLGVILGTAAYMAPEQARGGPVDKRADVFAFGCVLYEMLAGRRAFEGETVSDTLAAVLRAEVDWSALPAATPPALRTLLERCLDKDRKKRLADIADTRFELAAAARPALATAPVPRRRSRESVAWAVAGLLAVALAGALVWPRGRAAPPGRLAFRLPLALPAGSSLALGNDVTTAISPDGRRLVMAIQDGSGRHLLLRDLGTLEPRLLAGSEGAQQPFFSPDGEWVGFFAGNQLRKLPVGGGSPITLSSQPVGQSRGGTFCPDGSVVYAPNSAVGLLRLPAAGGAPEVLTTPDAQRSERTHRWPSPVAGCKAILFTCDTRATTEFYDDARIEAVVVATGARKVVVEGASRAQVVGDVLIFARGGSLYAVAFDSERLEVTGRPVPVLQGVSTDVATGAAHFDVAREGSLIYVPGTAATSSTTAEWAERGGVTSPSGVPAGQWSQLALSRDARRVALAGSLATTSDIWVSDLERGSLSRLTFGDAASDPVWSPDGKSVAYGLQDGKSPAKIYLKPADGSAEAKLLYENPTSPVLPRDFSPDGELLVVEAAQTGGTSDLWGVPTRGDGKPFPLVQSFFDEYTATVAPDGKFLAYNSDESGNAEIYVRPFPQGAGRWQVSVGGGVEPRWSPDGSAVFYRNAGALYRVAIDARAGFAAGRPERLLEGMDTGGNASTYGLARDGRTLRLLRSQSDGGSGAALVVGWADEVRRTLGAER